MQFNSLRGQLLAWLLLPLATYVAFNGWVTYKSAIEMATVVQDRMLLGAARIIAEQIRYDDEIFQVTVPPSALELFESGAQDHVYYRVTSSKGTLLAGSEDFPLPASMPRIDAALHFNATFRDQPVRIVAYSKSVIAAPDDTMVIVEIAQTLHAHKILSDSIWEHTIQQQLLIMLLVAGLAWIGMRRGLAPTMRLRDHVQNRRPSSLEPLDATPVPNELVPLVDAINHYVGRLDEHMSAHDRFIANASHQLRTPLAALNTQVDYGLRSDTIEGKNAALRAINGGVQHGIRLVNQLLTLSSAGAIGNKPQQHMRPVDLVKVVQQIFEELAIVAQDRSIDLGFECKEEIVHVADAAGMLDELVSNLVDNALRYAPIGGIVTVSVERQAEHVVLRVEDNGPGIPESERERVFERFYRIDSARHQGTGLGLAIVQEIVIASGASISLEAPSQHSGLIVSVRFAA